MSEHDPRPVLAVRRDVEALELGGLALDGHGDPAGGALDPGEGEPVVERPPRGVRGQPGGEAALVQLG